jgi:CrcB protein
LESYLLVFLGSALGGAGRYLCSGLVARRVGETFPWGTFFVNVVGSFVIGLVYGLTSIGVPLREFVMVGICGGYTTFSSFSLQTLTLIREDELLRAGANVVCSVVACVAAAWLGVVAAEASGQAGSLIASALSAWIGYLVAAKLGQATKVSP